MTITMSVEEEEQLWDEIAHFVSDATSDTYEIPKQLGKGGSRSIEVHPEISLAIMDYKYHHDVII